MPDLTGFIKWLSGGTPKEDIREFVADGATNTGAGVSVEVLRPNKARVGATFTNNSDTDMYLIFNDPAIAGAIGKLIKANGGVYAITLFNPWHGAVSVYCAAGAKSLCWSEQIG